MTLAPEPGTVGPADASTATASICRQNEPAQSPPVGTAVPLPNGRPGVSAEVTVAHLPTCSPEGLRWLNGQRARYGLTRRVVATSQLRANREGTGGVMSVDQGSGVRVLEDPLTNK